MNNKKTFVNKLKKGGENMKRNMIRSIVGAVFVVLMTASSSFAVLTGSAHDLTASGANGVIAGITEICEPCHTPHNSIDTPYLWNHAASIGTIVEYDSPQMEAVLALGGGTNSLKCLSCHDGTVGVDNFGGSGGNTFIGLVGLGVGDLGEDLQDDHPIAFNYQTHANSDNGLWDTGVIGGGINSVMDIQMTADPEMGCPSCHEVHNSTGPAIANMLRTDNTGSALCLDCHNK